jgi:putative hemolysin
VGDCGRLPLVLHAVLVARHSQMVVLEILVVLVLISINGVLAMSEFAVISSRTSRLRQMARSGVHGARMALRLIRDPGRFLSTVQIGITLVGIFAGAFSGATIGVKLGAWLNSYALIAPRGEVFGIGIMVVLVTYLSLVVGELVPKRIALVNPERIASLLARPMFTMSRVAAPIVWTLKISTDSVLKLLGISGGHEKEMTEEEVRALLTEAMQAGIFVAQERAMIEGVLRMAHRSVRAIMTRREKVLWLDQNADAAALLDASSSNPSARLLVCDGTIDRPLGVIHTKDLVPVVLRGEEIELEDLLTPVLQVASTTPILQVLERFRRQSIHVAVVTAAADGDGASRDRPRDLDTHQVGYTQGLVTLTDILESIAGEFPEGDEGSETFIVRRRDGSWLIDGRMSIEEFRRLIRLDDFQPAPGIETVAGLVLDRLQRIPREGESFVINDARVEIVDMDGKRIDKVIVSAEPGKPELAFP